MTATAAQQGGIVFQTEHSAIPYALQRKLGANAQIGKGQFATVDLTTGFAALNDGSVPNQISVGNGDVAELSDTSATAGAAAARFSQRWFYGLLASTSGGDGFADTDWGVPFWIATENTLGKKSNLSGNNRSLGGLVFGLAQDGTPYAWDGPVAALLARATLITNAVEGSSHTFADAAANTATTETAMARQPFHGVVTAVQFIPTAAVAASNTDFTTVTISKRDGAGGGAVTVATYDSRAANQGAATQWVPMSFALSGTAANLNLLETDILTITATKSGAGQQLTGRVRVVQKVI